MRPFNVEIYDSSFNYKDHTGINNEKFKYKYDYLDPEKNKVEIPTPTRVAVNDYLRILDGEKEIWGIVSKVEKGTEKEKKLIDVTYTDIMGCFDVDILADTDLLGIGSLEQYIMARIAEVFVSGDEYQRIPGLTLATEGSTTGWTLDISADNDTDHYTKVNLLDDIILGAFRKYEVRLSFVWDIGAKAIRATISKNTASVKVIETEFPNIISKSVKYKTIKKEINKDLIYNKKDCSMRTTYYLHPDGSYDTVADNRISPVTPKLESVSTKTASEYEANYQKTLTSGISKITSAQKKLEKGESLDEETIADEEAVAVELNTVDGISITVDQDGRVTGWDKDAMTELVDEYVITEEYANRCVLMALAEFNQKAQDKAAKTFGSNKYENLIEIECLAHDALVTPEDLSVGQLTDVIDEGSTYRTILTGREVTNKSVKLIYGNVRIELTKQIKGRS